VRTHNRDGRGTRRVQRYVCRAASRSSRPVCHTSVSTTTTTTTRQPTNERDSARAHTLGHGAAARNSQHTAHTLCHGGATRNTRHTAHTTTLTREDFDLAVNGAAWHAVQVCNPDEFSRAVADVRLCASRFEMHGGCLKRITANSTVGVVAMVSHQNITPAHARKKARMMHRTDRLGRSHIDARVAQRTWPRSSFECQSVVARQ
jgi:hypothetical protein